MINLIRVLIRKNIFVRKITGYFLASSGLFDNYFKNYKLSHSWQKRLDDTLLSKDNNYIPRTSEAGAIIRGKQIMHNGIKIHLGSYYGPEYAVVFQKTKGVHEPHEERIFGEVLSKMRANSTMIELGAFWSFYSMWFNISIKNAKNIMVEPDNFNLGQGKRNFILNKLKGTFIQAFSGSEDDNSAKIPILTVDTIINTYGIALLDILHCDIQGYEYQMLLGCKKAIENDQIGYFFISTHSNEIHYQCLDFLKNKDYLIIAEADLNMTFSEDGLIVARSKKYSGIDEVMIDKRYS
jgi:hypothetical protein